MNIFFDEFEWDRGNIEKCQKHGLALSDIEIFLRGQPRIAPDLKHSKDEPRYIAVGKIHHRPVFVAFTYRQKFGKRFVRPISARYMHRKEAENYGQ